MTIPQTSIYVRPGSTSTTWTYDGASVSSAAITAVSFSLDTSWSQQVSRGDFQYSGDGGRSWTTYTLQADVDGSYVPAAGTLWRFVDHDGNDLDTGGSFTMHWRLADGSTVVNSAAVVADNQPMGFVDDRSAMLSTLRGGDFVANLAPIDTGAPDGGRWVIEGQSQAGLFAVSVDAGTGAARLVVADPAAIPTVGEAATVTLHYYDHYQLDAAGNPFANTGVSDMLAFTVLQGSSQDLAGFGPDLTLGGASGAQASPAVAGLSAGGFVTVWQGGDAAVWAQVRDASGAASGAAFAVTPTGDTATEGAPAVSALGAGRFVVAYTVQQDGANATAWRVVDANGGIGPQVVGGAAGDALEPTVTTLADGSFVVGWRSGGQVHLRHADAGGVAIGAEQIVGALGTAFSPSVSALGDGDYVVSWGEIGDGNVYAALGSSLGASPIQVTTDGAAASISTAAPLPHVTALAGGGFVVAWDSYSNDQRGFAMSDIFFQRYDNAGNALGTVGQANVESGAGHFDASVAALADGGFVIEWQAQNGDGDAGGVFGRRFGADGAALDAHEFHVNEQAQGEQASPAVAVLANGGVVSSWIDTQQGASSVEVRVLAGSGGADGGQGGGSGSGGAVTPTPDQITGTDAGNLIASGSGSHAIDGGGGTDTVVYQGAHADYAVAIDAAGMSVSGGGVQDTLVNVERLQFSDGSVAFDVNGTAGEAYRLYNAAFERAPDAAGLGYWIKMLDGGQSLNQVAAAFASSQEFADLYGANVSDGRFVELLYQNVLHRPADAGGYDFWVASMEEHGESRAEVLSHFSESAENQAQVVGSIGHGMLFTPWA